MWADRNLGANQNSEAGYYYSWGNVDGHQRGSGYDFSAQNYAESPGNQVSGNITAENDAATVLLGASKRMPTSAEYSELVSNCSIAWVTINGVYGRLFTSNINGNAIFLPAAGYYNGAELSGDNNTGDYWTASWNNENTCRRLYFNNMEVNPANLDHRRLGFPIRAVAVREDTNNRSVDLQTSESESKFEETHTENDDNQR